MSGLLGKKGGNEVLNGRIGIGIDVARMILHVIRDKGSNITDPYRFITIMSYEESNSNYALATEDNAKFKTVSKGAAFIADGHLVVQVALYGNQIFLRCEESHESKPAAILRGITIAEERNMLFLLDYRRLIKPVG